MSRTKNIGGVIDAFYRYTRPELKVKEELRGTNGQRTVIENIEDIAKAYRMPPPYPIQFLGYELSVNARFQEKTKAGGRTCAVFAGIHSLDKLETLLTKFERLFIVCPNCKDGGTRLAVSKAGVRIKCGACGKRSPAKGAHKVEKFMEKHPPVKPVADGLSIASAEDGDGDGDGDEEKVAEEKASRKKKSKEPKEPKEPKEQKEQKGEGEEVEEEPQTPVAKMKAFVHRKGLQSQASLTEMQIAELVSELDRIALVHGLDRSERLSVGVLGMFDFSSAELEPVLKRCKAFAPVFRMVAPDRAGKKALLGTLMKGFFVENKGREGKEGGKEPRLLPVLMALYSTDVIEEDDFRDWHAAPPESDNWAIDRLVAIESRTAAKPFLNWLDTAEEEE